MKINLNKNLLFSLALLISTLFVGACSKTPEAPAGTGGVSGKWDFVCCSEKYKGTITLTQNGDKITGTFNETGKIEGEVKGNTVTFQRKWETGTQDFTLTLSADGKTMTGNFKGTQDSTTGTDTKLTKVS